MNGDVPFVADFLGAYQGEFDSIRDFTERLTDDIGVTADWPATAITYFDWEQGTHDQVFDYTTTPAPAGGVYLLCNPRSR